jgi:hypothetical protein
MAADLADSYIRDKSWYLVTHIQATRWVRNFVYYVAYYIVMLDGTHKFSIMDVWFTSGPLTIVLGLLMVFQFFFLLLFNNWFAEGNLLLIFMWIYGLITSVSSVLVWSNLDWYDYNLGFRIWRYIIFAISLFFCTFYTGQVVSVIVMFERNKS